MRGGFAHSMKAVGFFCLVGQGFLLFNGTGQTLSEGLPAPWLMLILSLVLAVAGTLRDGKFKPMTRSTGKGGEIFWSGLFILSLALLSAVSLKSMIMGSPTSKPGNQFTVEQVRLRDELIVNWRQLDQAVPEILIRSVTNLHTSRDSLDGGDLFRSLNRLAENWDKLQAGSQTLSIEGTLWVEGQRSAWTEGAEPLGSVGHQSDSDGLKRGRHHWFRRITRSVGPGLVLELQIPLDDGLIGGELAQLGWQVLPLGEAPLVVNEEGQAVADVVFEDAAHGLGLQLVSKSGSLDEDSLRQTNARIMLLAGVGWFVALLCVGRLSFGLWGFLAAFWVGRTVLAVAGFFRWGTWAFPEVTPPAAPDRLVSLLDPAYFATPVLFGFLASTADALLTAALVAASAWGLLRAMGRLGNEAPGQKAGFWGIQGVPGPLSGLLFGLSGAGVLVLVRQLATLLAVNSNPRLIGESVPLSVLTFWCLHLVLMLLAFSLFALMVGLWASRSWPGRDKMTHWVFGAMLAFAASLGASYALSNMWWAGHLLLALTVLGMWLIAPALGSRPRVLRRSLWPVLLLLMAIWNYASLSEIYQRAEHGWLKTKADLLAEPTNSSAPYLLDEALREMRDQDGLSENLPTVGHDVWQDEPAYLLWRNSSLRDMGFPLLVEIIDEYNREESLFTTGFMGDHNYQVARRTALKTAELPPEDLDASRVFEQEQRLYPDGQELVLAGEVSRKGDRGWIRVEFPVRSWRLNTQLAALTRRAETSLGGYRPRSEVDRPVLLLRGDNNGWLDVGPLGIPSPESRPVLQRLKSGKQDFARIRVEDGTYLCLWQALDRDLAHFPGEGYLLGVRQATLLDKLLDLSRLMLLDLLILALLVLMAHFWRRMRALLTGENVGKSYSFASGFQERFLMGYLFFGLLLLLAVGASVDRVGHDRVGAESSARTRAGLETAVQQLRSLLVEQARSLSRSDYINDMLIGQLAGQRPVSSLETRQAMVFGGEGSLILDETLSDLTDDEARVLLAAGRTSPMLIMEETDGLFVATVIPIDLSGVLAIADTTVLRDGRVRDGFFLYRQKLDRDLLGGLAELVQGQATLRLAGRPVLASHPEGIFSGREALLTDPHMMGTLLDHAQAAGVFAAEGRPFAFIGAQPLPAFSRPREGGFRLQNTPAVLAVAFPDREKQYVDQRRGTNLFLAGLANLILLTALVLALLMSWNLFRPLRVLLTATRSMARGDFSAPLPEPGRDEVGRLASAFSGMRSELATARDELEARERFLASVLDRVTVGVAVVDGGGKVISLNPAGSHILAEFEPEIEKNEGVLKLLERFRKLAAGAQRWGGEMRSAEGLRTLRGAMAPLDLPDGTTDTMLVFEDITEFLQTRKMAINAELARQVAHEIKNPLTPIQLSVQLLQQAWQDKHPRLDEIVPDTVQRVLAQVDLLRSIAAEFSLLGRPGQLEREDVDLLDLVQTVVDRYGAEDPDSVIKVDLQSAELPLVLAHPDSLAKILGNLMQNSLDAVADNQDLKLDLMWRIQSESVTLMWADNGAGLDADVADRLFDPYFSTKSKGTGLGLAICRNLADRMGGSIILRNRPDAPGALAELTLPRAKADHPEGPAR